MANHLLGGRLDAAEGLARRLQETFPDDFRLAALLGRILLARGNAVAGRQELRRAAEADPEDRETWSCLAATGLQEAVGIAADLPPLDPPSDEGRAISAIALGHLYLRQLLLVQCAAQFAPIWRSDPGRLDVGCALAEAHWRLGDQREAEEVCRAVLQAAPACLKANLILAQLLSSTGRGAEASPLVDIAQRLDPENAVAAELYEWLTVLDPGLAPVQRADIMVEIEAHVEKPAAAEAPQPVAAEAAEPVAAEAPEPVATETAEPAAAETAEPVATEAAEPAASAGVSELDELAQTAPEPLLVEIEAQPPPAEHEPEWPALARVTMVNVNRRGQVEPARLDSAASQARSAAAGNWNAACGRMGQVSGLGELRASSVESATGIVQMVLEDEEAVLAFAPAAANLGLLRSALRRAELKK